MASSSQLLSSKSLKDFKVKFSFLILVTTLLNDNFEFLSESDSNFYLLLFYLLNIFNEVIVVLLFFELFVLLLFFDNMDYSVFIILLLILRLDILFTS